MKKTMLSLALLVASTAGYAAPYYGSFTVQGHKIVLYSDQDSRVDATHGCETFDPNGKRSPDRCSWAYNTTDQDSFGVMYFASTYKRSSNGIKTTVIVGPRLHAEAEARMKNDKLFTYHPGAIVQVIQESHDSDGTQHDYMFLYDTREIER
ncbi:MULTISPECIES: hypothetical protein [Burkholderia]|uniref:hypothetical protein n=1 Tax=Burkholderia TaxID=32008 RepID=UPI000BF7AD62|nr:MULTISPECIES: hypothetical protein [Burkholderia]PFH19030.1 hypothetical protein BX604_5623 [Burkholderia sp. JKS000303]